MLLGSLVPSILFNVLLLLVLCVTEKAKNSQYLIGVIFGSVLCALGLFAAGELSVLGTGRFGTSVLIIPWGAMIEGYSAWCKIKWTP